MLCACSPCQRNHLSGLKTMYYKLCFKNVQDLMDVRRVLQPVIEKNKRSLVGEVYSATRSSSLFALPQPPICNLMLAMVLFRRPMKRTQWRTSTSRSAIQAAAAAGIIDLMYGGSCIAGTHHTLCTECVV